ncbi:MAG: site-specific integrase [Candidatus Tectomicrobia bacterium]|uniref:Site-specific integrase n=1 Tax=Tectimicrobiota bacterium TaxID=2528274 RepID=A0A938B1Z2_UNCTE|nr:site-specific integrase [Candidatus Tectomicrobia bacterium]
MAKKRGNHEGSITRRKDGLWMAQVTLGRDPQTGKSKRATFYAKTRQAAAEQLAKALRDHQQGTLVAPHKLTLGTWLDTWLQDYKRPKLRPLTFDSYEMVVRRHLKPMLGHLLIQDVRPEHLQHFYNAKTQQGLSARTVRYCHTLLHSALAQAEKNQVVARNVATLVTPPRKTRQEMHTLTSPQIANHFLPAIAADRLFAAVFLLFGTGLRRGELLGLRWKDADVTAGVLHIRQTLVRVKNHDATADTAKSRLIFEEPKTASSRRTVPIPAECLTALKHHKARQAEEKLLLGPAYEDHGLIFCRPNGHPIEPSKFSTHFQTLLQQASVPAIRLHDARHTFATLLLELGESPKTVQTMLGHSSVAMTLDIYSHVSLELETKAAAKLNAVLSGGQ